MKTVLLILLATGFISSCVVDRGKTAVDIRRKGKIISSGNMSNISNVRVIDNQLIITGVGLDSVTGVKVDGNSLNQNFTIETKSSTQIVANADSAFAFDLSKVFNLILSDANAAATYQIDFNTTAPISINATNTNGVLKVNSGDSQTSTWGISQMSFGYHGANEYPHFLRTRHNNVGLNNAFDFFTSDGTQAGVYPTNAVLGLTINNGAVGVNKLDPERALHVHSTQQVMWTTEPTDVVVDSTNPIGAGITLRPKASVTYPNGWSVYSGTGSSAIGDGAIGFWNHTVSAAMFVVSATGDVGIGVNNPTYKLDVSGGYAHVDGLRMRGSDGQNTIYQANVGTDLSATANGGNIRFGQVNAPNDLLITPAGDVGINNLSPAYKLDVTGDINASGAVRAATTPLSSDKRWKRNIKPLENAIEKLKKITGVSYIWAIDDYPEKHFQKGTQIGVIAQDVQKVFPEMISKDKDDYLSVNYPALIAPLIEAVKGQQTQIEKVTQQTTEISSLKAENKKLKEVNSVITAYLCSKDPKAPFCISN